MQNTRTGNTREEGNADGPTEATREEMSAAKLPLQYRDQCAHLLIPLNKCRYDNYYLPWRCNVCLTIELIEDLVLATRVRRSKRDIG